MPAGLVAQKYDYSQVAVQEQDSDGAILGCSCWVAAIGSREDGSGAVASRMMDCALCYQKKTSLSLVRLGSSSG